MTLGAPVSRPPGNRGRKRNLRVRRTQHWFPPGRNRGYIPARHRARAQGRNAMTSGGSAADRLTVQGIELEVLRRGAGRTALLLHGFDTVDAEAPFLDLLGHHIKIIAPSSPGFGHSPRPRDFDTVYDLVHLYLAVLDALPGDKVSLIGFSFGGWLAAGVAAARPPRPLHPRPLPPRRAPTCRNL